MNAKEALTQWLASGDLERTLQGLEVVFDQQRIKQDERLVIQQSRYHTLQSEYAQGTISHADYTLEFSKIRKAVQELVNGLADHWSAEGLERIPASISSRPNNPATPLNPAKPDLWKRIGYIGLLLGILASMVKLIEFCTKPAAGTGDTMQLTVFVQGLDKKPIDALQNAGRILVRYGNASPEMLIGQGGRCNFGEIPPEKRNEDIDIVCIAAGYEPVYPDKKYKMDGQPVYFFVQRDKSLGSIQGIVKDRSGEQLIAGALVMIDNDTTTHTDSLGRFRLQLPPQKQRDTYAVSIRKEGFLTKNDYFKPQTGPIEIRLDKK